MSVAFESEPKVSDYVAQCLVEERLPIIDIGDYLSGDPAAREQFATDLRAFLHRHDPVSPPHSVAED